MALCLKYFKNNINLVCFKMVFQKKKEREKKRQYLMAKYIIGLWKDMENSKFRHLSLSMKKTIEWKEKSKNIPNYEYFEYDIIIYFFKFYELVLFFFS